MAAPRKRPGDMTGRQAEILTELHADEIRANASTLSTMTQAPTNVSVRPDNTITDMTNPRAPKVIELAEDDDTEVELLSKPTRVIRLNSPIEQMTIGHGNHYDFEEGKRYEVPRHVAEHLEEKGYVWH